MIVKEYKNADTFLEAYETFLLEREAVSQLLLYSAYQNRYNAAEDKGMFGAVLMEELPVLLFCNFMPFDLVVYVAREEEVSHAAEELAGYICQNHIVINGIVARNDVCQSFIDQFKKLVSCNFSDGTGMDIMELRQIRDVKPVEGSQRLALPEEAKLLADWMIDFQIEALMNDLDYEAALNKIKNLIVGQNVYLYENEEGQAVTMAATVRKLPHGMAIAYVFTPEEFRGKGYAAANMYYLSKRLLEEGYEFCTLLVDKNNPLSNRAYEKVGYEILEDSYTYKLIPYEA